jgi:hypothetical protein
MIDWRSVPSNGIRQRRLGRRDIGIGGRRCDASLPDVQRANEGARSRFNMRTVQAVHHFPRSVRHLALCRIARPAAVASNEKTEARSDAEMPVVSGGITHDSADLINREAATAWDRGQPCVSQPEDAANSPPLA